MREFVRISRNSYPNKYDKIYITKRITCYEIWNATVIKKKAIIEHIDTVIEELIIYRVTSLGTIPWTKFSDKRELIRNYQRIRSLFLNREFNEYKFGLSDRAVKAFARDAPTERSLIIGD